MESQDKKQYELTKEEQKALQALYQVKQQAEASFNGALNFLTASKEMAKSALSADFSKITETE